MGFIGSAEHIIFNIEPGVLDNSQVFSGGSFWYCLGVGWVMGREGVSDEMVRVINVKALTLVGLRSSCQSLNQLALLFREFLENIMAVWGGR